MPGPKVRRPELRRKVVAIVGWRRQAYSKRRSAGGFADAPRRAIARGLLDSIEAGDGKTAATAFTVISVSEEYELMRAMGVKVAQQSLINQGGHVYDLLAGTGPTGAPASYYFLIDRVMAAESAGLNLPKPHPQAP